MGISKIVEQLILTDNARLISFDDRYCVTKDGRIFSRVSRNHRNKDLRFGEWRPIKPALTGQIRYSQYFTVAFYINGKNKRIKIHRLVLEAFIGPMPKDFVSRHLDGDPFNNHLSNLAYSTKKVNMMDKRKHGTMYCGERHHSAKLQREQVVLIRERLQSGIKIKKIASEFKTTIKSIYHIKHKTAWKWL